MYKQIPETVGRAAQIHVRASSWAARRVSACAAQTHRMDWRYALGLGRCTERAGAVSCVDDVGSSVTCSASDGCTDFPTAREPPFTVCGNGTGTGGGAVTCDGPSDCPPNNDCCAEPGGQHCLAQTQPGVIGSGCAAYDTNPNGPQASVVCDPLNPITTCPPNKSCTIDANAAIVYGFSCQ